MSLPNHGITITGTPGLISSLSGLDDISGLNGDYELIQSGGSGAIVNMYGGIIASFTPGQGYSVGTAVVTGGTRFTINSVTNGGVTITGGITLGQ